MLQGRFECVWSDDDDSDAFEGGVRQYLRKSGDDRETFDLA